MKNKRIVIWVCLGVICCVCLAIGCSKVEPLQTVAAEGHTSVQQVEEADTEFKLDFYFATLAEDEAVTVPKGYKLMQKGRYSYLVRIEPDLTGKDVRDITLEEFRSSRGGEETGTKQHIVFHLQASAAEALAQLTEKNIHKPFLIVLNGEVLAAPIIRAQIASGKISLPLSEVTEQQQAVLLSFSARPPEIIPGTAKITVKARFGDGAKPLGAKCRIKTYAPTKQFLPMTPESEDQRVVPTVVGADGDWTIYNVPEGAWSVWVRGDDFAFVEADNCKVIGVKAAEEKSVNFTLVRGGSVTGRVIYADTGKPVSGNRVTAGLPGAYCCGTTDAEGYYIVRHVAPGPTTVRTQVEGYVIGRSETVEVKDETTVTAADIRLRRGGWISGRVVRPEDAHQSDSIEGRVRLRLEGEGSGNAVVFSDMVWEDQDFCFRLGPLLPGSYALEAQLDTWGEGKMLLKRWRGEVKRIQVRIGAETKDVVIKVTPTNG